MDRAFRNRIERAFRLAYFLCGERPAALATMVEALAKVETAAAAQKKRRYYRPTGRPGAGRFRTRVAMSEPQLLQRLICIESEPHELDRERSGRAGGDDLIVAFVKHLIRITVRRNSFYVALGLTRILHDYPTAAAVDLYSLVVGDPARARDDYYYRSRKLQLMKELEERFSGLLERRRSARGEQRFSAQPPGRVEPLVRRCLTLLTPWESACLLPDRVDPLRDELPELRFAGGDPDQEHPIEVRRMHAVTHPECFQKLIDAFGLELPADRLTVPSFQLARDAGAGGGGDFGDRDRPDALTASELEAILHELDERERRRRRASAVLRVRVDGRERARLVPGRAERVRLDLEEGAELVEVVTDDEEGELVVATYLLEEPLPGRQAEAEVATLRHASGLELTFHAFHDSERHLYSLDIACQARPMTAMMRAWSAIGHPFSLGGSSRFHPAALLAAAILVLALALPILLRDVEERDGADHPVATTPREESPSSTRSPAAVAPKVTLADVRRVFVAPLGEDDFARELRRHLVRSMPLIGMEVTGDPQEADAALKPLVSDIGSSQLALIDAEGAVLWRAPAPREGETPEAFAGSMLDDLHGKRN